MRRSRVVVVVIVVALAFVAGIVIGRHGATKNAGPFTGTTSIGTTSTTTATTPGDAHLPMSYRVGAALVPLSAMPAGSVEVLALDPRISCTPMGFAAGSRAFTTYRLRDGRLLSESVNFYGKGAAPPAMKFVRTQFGCRDASDAQHHRWTVTPVGYPRIASDQATYRLKAADTTGEVMDIAVLRVNDRVLLVLTSGGPGPTPADVTRAETFARNAFDRARSTLGG